MAAPTVARHPPTRLICDHFCCSTCGAPTRGAPVVWLNPLRVRPVGTKAEFKVNMPVVPNAKVAARLQDAIATMRQGCIFKTIFLAYTALPLAIVETTARATSCKSTESETARAGGWNLGAWEATPRTRRANVETRAQRMTRQTRTPRQPAMGHGDAWSHPFGCQPPATCEAEHGLRPKRSSRIAPTSRPGWWPLWPFTPTPFQRCCSRRRCSHGDGELSL